MKSKLYKNDFYQNLAKEFSRFYMVLTLSSIIVIKISFSQPVLIMRGNGGNNTLYEGFEWEFMEFIPKTLGTVKAGSASRTFITNVKTENVLVSESTMKAPRYFRLMVRNEPGVIAKISAVFADQNISIEALIQHETKDKNTGQTEEVPVIILSGSVSNQVVDKLLEELNQMEEVANCLKQFRIYTKIK